MHSSKMIRAFLSVAAVAAAVVGAQGCVSDRPSRNGVFNENQYIRKDFLVRPVTAGMPATDPGWYMKATVVQASSPNPLASFNAGGIFTGSENSGAIVRFVITSDKMMLADMRELANNQAIDDQDTRTPSIVNAWPITNVDLKYRVNLDGEKTNFYEENQELDWQVRQWVKVNFDKNDLSDITGLGAFQTLMLGKCTDGPNTSATLVPNSFLVDETNNYMEWTVEVVAPLDLGGTANSADCATAYGQAGLDFVRMGRQNVVFNVKYSMVRANVVDPTQYTPLVIAEKDPILHKYGPIMITNWSRDPNTGLQAARQLALRYNPAKPIVWYFAQGYPEDKKDVWTRTGGIVDQTNAIFTKAGAAARLSVLNYNDATTLGDAAGPNRQYGDVRYNFFRWESDLDTDSPFLAVTQFQPDLRTGELVSASINFADKPIQADRLGARLQAYLETVIGFNPSDPKTDLFADPPPDPAHPGMFLPSNCTSGTSIPLVASALQANIYSQSTLYQRMAQYLPKPANGDPTPGPADYVFSHAGADSDTFYKAYFTLLPYITYADPTMNQYVTPADLGPPPGVGMYPDLLHGETLFQQAMSDTDHGQSALAGAAGEGPAAMLDLYNQIDDVRQKWQMHRDFVYKWQKLNHSLMRGDTTDIISFTSMAQRGSRMCVNGAWEKQADWLTRLAKNYYELVIWHEFGHVLGMEHNFMGSVDRANFPTYKAADGTTQYGKYSSSVMEYSQAWDDATWNNGTSAPNGWLAYDQGAIGFMYSNNLDQNHIGPVATPTGATAGISGQASATAPWNDPNGFQGTTETQFLYCSHQHLRFTPLCRENDVGTTPSEIEAADIESYDWNYKWRNFRNYYKSWDESTYGASVADLMGDTRKFLSLDVWDWSFTEIMDKLIRIGITPPSGASNSGLFYTQLATHFLADVGSAEQLVAAFHEAVIQQSTGQRPYLTQFDPYFGDVTQQGIIIDKELALINWLGLWEYDNYDPSQANGYYGSSLVIGPEDQGVTGGSEPTQSWSTASSMLGEKGPWDAYPAFFPAAISLFGHDTQNANFTVLAYPQMRDWIGGHSFTREQDALDYFKNIAVKNSHAQIWINDPLAGGATDPAHNENCNTFQTCTYNPMLPQVTGLDIGHSNPTTQAFIGPDNRRWAWVYLSDRNMWFFVDQDRNPSSYYQVYTYNTDVNTLYDDGNIGPVYNYDAKIKFMIDAYAVFGGNSQAQ
jgi:hypothetical protein